MFSYIKNATFNNPAIVVIPRSLDCMMIATTASLTRVSNMLRSAPTPSSISLEIGTNKVDFRSKDFNKISDEMINLAIEGLNIKTYSKFNSIFRALLSNIGLGIVDVTGIKLNNKVYGLDFGFELKNDNVSIYINSDFIFKPHQASRPVFGYDINSQLDIVSYDRKYSYMTEGEVIHIKIGVVNDMLTDLIPGITKDKIVITPDFGFVITGLYTSLSNNSVAFAELDEDLELALSLVGSVVNGTDIAIKERQVAADLIKTIAITPNAALGTMNVANMKLSAADVIQKLGCFMLFNTVDTGLVKAQQTWAEISTFASRSIYMPQEYQYSLCHAASTLSKMLSNCSYIDGVTLFDLLEELLSLQPAAIEHQKAHKVYDESGSIIGLIPKQGESIMFESLDHVPVRSRKLQKMVISDAVLSAAELANAAVDSLNARDVYADLIARRDEALASMASINLYDINKQLALIDERVARTMETLISMEASNDVIAARANNYLKAAKLILQMPLKTAYSAIPFGTLAEFLTIETTPDGTSTVHIIEGKDVPFMATLTQNQCGRNWIIRNSDPGSSYNNHVLITDTYGAQINDLNGKRLTYTKQRYQVTPEQTRGSGKCKQVVVPETFLPDQRGYLSLRELLDQIKGILETILNNEVMKANAQIKNAVSAVTAIANEFTAMRKPYQERLMHYFELASIVFFCNHGLSQLDLYYQPQQEFIWPADYQMQDEEEDISALYSDEQLIAANTVMQHIRLNDIAIQLPEEDERELELLKNDLQNIATELINLDRDEDTSKSKHSITTHFDYSRLYEGLNESTYHTRPDFTLYAYAPLDDESAIQVLQQTLTSLQEQDKALHQRYVALLQKRKKLIEDAKSVYEVRFDNTHCDVVENSFIIDTEVGNFEFTIEDLSDTDETRVTVIRCKSIELKATDTFNLQDMNLRLGGIVYSLKVLLEHELIYGCMPLTPLARRSISYKLFNHTEASDADIYAEVKDKLGSAYADAMLRYLTKDKDDSVFVMSMVLCFINNPLLTIVTLKTFNETQLSLKLQDMGYDGGNISSLRDIVSSLTL